MEMWENGKTGAQGGSVHGDEVNNQRTIQGGKREGQQERGREQDRAGSYGMN